MKTITQLDFSMNNKSFTKECLLRTVITILVMLVLSLLYAIVGD